MEIIAADFDSFGVIVAYCSPLCREDDITENIIKLIKKFKSGKFIHITGDFNVNIMVGEHRLVDTLSSFGYSLGVNISIPSTIYGSQIDLLFTNQTEIKSFYAQSFYSDHYPLFFVI